MLTRRACCVGLGFLATQAGSAEQVDQTVRRQRWLSKFHSVRQRDPQGALRLQKFPDDMYIVLEPIKWRPGPSQPAELPSVIVPRGFVTDLASVPPIFFSVLRADGPYAFAAVVHDYLYWTQTVPKETADKVLDYAMRDFAVAVTKRMSIVAAVQAFGISAWESNRKAREAGTQRILKSLPNDPRTTWRDWSRRADVFL